MDIRVGRPTPDRTSQTITHHITHNHTNKHQSRTPDLRPDVPDNNTTYKYPINQPRIPTISPHITQHITRIHTFKPNLRSQTMNITHQRLCHVTHSKSQSSVTTEYTSHTEPIRMTKHNERFKISPSLECLRPWSQRWYQFMRATA